MDAHLITVDGVEHDASAANISELLRTSTRFWLDMSAPEHGDIDGLLQGTFGFHPLAVEDAEHFGQRPKVDTYDDFSLIVVYGVASSGDLVEVHCFYTDTYMVTVHHDPCPDLVDLGRRLCQVGSPRLDHVMVLYRAIDALIDSYFPVLSRLDDEIDQLEDEILQRPTEQQLGRLFDMKRSLIALRKVVTPQRDMFASLLSGGESLPGMTPDAERYFRDLYDHLIRISDLVDSYRDLMGGVLDTHLSTVSNRLNIVMKQLTVIATVFLPLSFLTGFFGQNFAWLVNRISGLPQFIFLAIGLEVAVVVGLMVLFRKRGWLTADGMVPSVAPARRPPVARSQRWQVLHPHQADTGA